MADSHLIPSETIENKIFLLRGQKVILSFHLAGLYGVETKILVQSVQRNINRFPDDFMFKLSIAEWTNLKSHFVTSSWGGIRKPPYAFSEQGVAMLSSVLRSERAVSVNIQIMRTFVKLREILSTHKELAQKLRELELKVKSHDENITAIFEAINQLLQPPSKPRRKIGFDIQEPRVQYKVKENN